VNIEISRERIKKLQRVASVIIISYLVLYYGLLWLLNENYVVIATDLMSPVGIILSLIIMFYAIQLHSSKPSRQVWIIFFLGMVAFLMGDIIWAYNELVRNENSFSPFRDGFYAMSAILVTIAFFRHIPQKSIFSAVRSGFDMLIAMVIYLSLEATFILKPIINNTALSNMDKFSALIYPIVDFGLFVLIILLYFNNDSNNNKRYFKSKTMIFIACIWLVADQTFILMFILGIYKSGMWIDPLWAASALGLSLVALHSAEFYLFTEEVPDNNIASDSQNISKSNLIIIYGSMIIFLAIWSYNYLHKEPLAIGGIIIILLVILRQYFSLLENQRLMGLVMESNKDLHEVKTRFEYELRTDYLTRLFNRRYIDGAVAELEKTGVENTAPFSVLVIDIDNFKQINDKYGHNTGDQVLQQIAKIIKMNIRNDDIAARWGGEEFIVLLPNTGESLAYSIGERIRSEIGRWQFKTDDTGQENIRISASIGISERNSMEQDFYKVLLRADQGMYEAKYAGRNRTVIKRIS
jgi:diguanylate cyclase (GGDEF)-like protein